MSEVTGPLNLGAKLVVDKTTIAAHDFSRRAADAPRAMGQLILIAGRVLDEDGRAVRGTIVELWHANSAGRYVHPADAESPAPIDENFIGSGRVETDDDGRFDILTIKPGAYPVPNHPHRWWRPPHIHFSVFGHSFASRLVTQMYFPGEPLNEQDLIHNAVPDPRGRARTIAKSIAMAELPMLNVVGFGHDIVIRGPRQTPFD